VVFNHSSFLIFTRLFPGNGFPYGCSDVRCAELEALHQVILIAHFAEFVVDADLFHRYADTVFRKNFGHGGEKTAHELVVLCGNDGTGLRCAAQDAVEVASVEREELASEKSRSVLAGV
jgi:hypothetical protein